MLTVFVMYERQKGGESFWARYLDLLPEVEWPSEKIDDADCEWMLIHTCLKKYPQIFDERTLTREHFIRCYAQVCTRSFGHGQTPFHALVPGIDNCNHADRYFQVININERLHREATPAYFVRERFMIRCDSLCLK